MTRRALLIVLALLVGSASLWGEQAAVLRLLRGAPPASPGSITTYYVSTTGSDSNNCTAAQNISTPKLTVKSGVACLSAGQLLYIRGGTYGGTDNVIDSVLNTVPSGTSFANAVTISGYPGETVILMPADGVHPVRLTTGAPSYLIVQDLIVDGSNQNGPLSTEGIYLGSGAHHNRFQRFVVRYIKSFGVGVSNGIANSPFNEFLDCEIHSTGDPGSTDATNGHAFYVSTTGNLVRGCDVHDNGGSGIDFFENSGAFNVADNVIEKNRVYRNGLNKGTQHALVLAWGAGNIARNNLIYGNRDGVLVYTNAFAPQLLNNTIYGNLGAGVEMQYYGSGPVIKNNIIFANGSGLLDHGGLAGSPDYGGVSPGANLLTNPLFVNAASGDFHLQATSPAIDAGVTLTAVPTDYDGNPRPRGAAYDLGAYERP